MNPCSFDEPLQFLALPFAIDFFLFGEIIILDSVKILKFDLHSWYGFLYLHTQVVFSPQYLHTEQMSYMKDLGEFLFIISVVDAIYVLLYVLCSYSPI